MLTIEQILAEYTDVPAYHAPYTIEVGRHQPWCTEKAQAFADAVRTVRQWALGGEPCRVHSDVYDGAEDSSNPDGLTEDERYAFEAAAEVDHD